MARQGLSEDRIHDTVLAELSRVTEARAVQDVALAVNWDRPEGLSNWWVGGVTYRAGLLSRHEVVKAERAVRYVASDLQDRFFARRVSFVPGGCAVRRD